MSLCAILLVLMTQGPLQLSPTYSYSSLSLPQYQVRRSSCSDRKHNPQLTAILPHGGTRPHRRHPCVTFSSTRLSGTCIINPSFVSPCGLDHLSAPGWKASSPSEPVVNSINSHALRRCCLHGQEICPMTSRLVAEQSSPHRETLSDPTLSSSVPIPVFSSHLPEEPVTSH